MQLTPNSITLTDGGNAASLSVDSGTAALSLKGDTTRFDITTQEGAITALIRAANTDALKPYTLLTSEFEVITGELSVIKASESGLALTIPPYTGSAPSGSPTYLKLTINGVEGVIPFYPL